jgi:Ca2+-binding EF-hand superfamily protein
MVNEIWVEFDQDDSGHLDKEETRRFLKRIFDMVGLKRNFDNDEFDDFFRSIDLTNDGKISKAEMKNFFNKMGLQQEKLASKKGGRGKHGHSSIEERRF